MAGLVRANAFKSEAATSLTSTLRDSSAQRVLARLPPARLMPSSAAMRQAPSNRALSPGGQSATTGNAVITGLTAEGVKVAGSASAAPRRLDSSPARPNTLAQVNRSFLALEMEWEREDAMRAAAFHALAAQHAEAAAAAVAARAAGVNAPFVLSKPPAQANSTAAASPVDQAAREAMRAVVPSASKLRNALRAVYRPVDQAWSSQQQKQSVSDGTAAASAQAKSNATAAKPASAHPQERTGAQLVQSVA